MNESGTADKSLMSIIGGWFKSGVVEISSASKIGHIRLMLNGLKNDKNKVAQQMGLKIYSLLEKGELKIPQVDNLFQELRQIDKVITVREAEIEQINKEKEIRLLEASGEVTGPSWAKEPAKAKQPLSPAATAVPANKVKKAPTKKRAATSEATKKTTAKAKKVAAKSKKTGALAVAKGSKTATVKKKTAGKRLSSVKKKPIKKPAAKGSKPAKNKIAKPKTPEDKKV